MANYDASIRVDAKINTKSAVVQLERLENRMEKTHDTIISLRSKLDSLKDTKIPTQEYKEIKNQIDVTEKKMADLLAWQEKFLTTGGKTASSVYKKMEYDLEELRNSLPYLKSELQDLIDTGEAFTLGQDTAEFAKITQQLKYKEKEFSTMSRQQDILERKIQKVSDGYKKLGDIAKKAFDSVGNMLKKANSYIDSFVKRIREVAQKHLPFFRKELEGTKNSLSEFGKQLKNFALSLFSFNQIGKIAKSVASGAKEGFTNLYNENERFRNSIESVKASLMTLKNAFAGAFSPIVEIAIPYIQELIGWLTEAANLIGQFIAALTGRKTYIRAIKQSAAVTEEASGAAKEEADAIENETEAMNKQLSPLDKLNNLSSENIKKNVDKENISDDNGDVGIGGIMFEEVPITNSILDMAEKVKDILKNLFEPLKEAWDREGKFVMDSWKYALDEVWKLIKDIGRDFLAVWQQPETVDMFADILHIIGDIGLIVGNLARNFREAWNENETGLRILENIRDIIAVIIHNIRLAADFTVEWAYKLNFSPILQAIERFKESLIHVADALSGILMDFYTMVLLPLAKWTVEKGLPELLDVFTAFNEKVDWQKLRDNLAEFWEHLEPFAETVGEGLIIFIDKCASALADFINSQEFYSFLTTIENWMDSVTPEDVATAFENIAKGLIALKVALLGFSAISAITSVLTTIKTFLTFFGVGGGATATVAGMEGVATSIGLLAIALGDLAIAVGTYLALDFTTDHLDILAEAMGRSSDQARILAERYDGVSGKLTILRDMFVAAVNGIEGYGFAADNIVGTGVALEKAMEDIANGAILTDDHMYVLQKRFNLTDEDIEMLRQEMLDANPELRNLADNFAELENASAETLEEVYYGLQDVSNGIYDADDATSFLYGRFGDLTEGTRVFFDNLATGVTDIGDYKAAIENTSGTLKEFEDEMSKSGEYIAQGLTSGFENTEVGIAVGNFFSKFTDSVSETFGIHSPAENMKPYGEYITLGILEGFNSKIMDFISSVQSLFGQIKDSINGKLEIIKESWNRTWTFAKDKVTSVFQTIESIIGSAVSWISGQIRSILSLFSQINTAARSMTSGALGSAMGGALRNSRTTTYSMSPSVNEAMAGLSEIEFPGYATGQVIPRTMRQHLAILGDNNRETEVVSPLSTIEQAVRNAIGGAQPQEINLNLTVECEGHQLLQIMQKLDGEYFKQTGKHAFA